MHSNFDQTLCISIRLHAVCLRALSHVWQMCFSHLSMITSQVAPTGGTAGHLHTCCSHCLLLTRSRESYSHVDNRYESIFAYRKHIKSYRQIRDSVVLKICWGEPKMSVLLCIAWLIAKGFPTES